MAIISVILPCFNCSKYIKESLLSALNQSFIDIEIIVINDGSTDNTLELLQTVKDPRLKIYSQSNLGPAAARNLGISLASGQYIALLDSDDVWLPHKLEYQLSHLENNPSIGISFCYSLLIDSEGKRLGPGICPPRSRITAVSPFWILLSNPLGCGSTALIKREILENIKIGKASGNRHQYFNEAISQVEDTDLWIRIAQSGEHIIQGIPEILALYRIHNNSLSAPLIKLEQSLSELRNNFFNHNLDYDTLKNRRLSKAFHLRYLAQVATMRGPSRSSALIYLLRAFLSDPFFLTRDLTVSLATILSAITKFLCGPSANRDLIKFISNISAHLFWTRFRTFGILAKKVFDQKSILTSEIMFSIIIPTNGKNKTLSALINSLYRAIENFDQSCEIIIIENHNESNPSLIISEITSKHLKQNISIKTIREKNLGSGFAREAGAKQASGCWLVFVDDDITVDSEYLKQAKSFIMADPTIGVLAGPIHGNYEITNEWIDEVSEFLAISDITAIIPKDFSTHQIKLPPSAALIIRKSAWLNCVSMNSRLSGRDKYSLLGAEDSEAILLIAKAGYEVRFHPRLCARHYIQTERLQLNYLCRLSFAAGLSCAYLRSILLNNKISIILLHLATPLYALLLLVKMIAIQITKSKNMWPSHIVKIFFTIGIMFSPLVSIFIFIRGKNYARYRHHTDKR